MSKTGFESTTILVFYGRLRACILVSLILGESLGEPGTCPQNLYLVAPFDFDPELPSFADEYALRCLPRFFLKLDKTKGADITVFDP